MSVGKLVQEINTITERGAYCGFHLRSSIKEEILKEEKNLLKGILVCLILFVYIEKTKAKEKVRA